MNQLTDEKKEQFSKKFFRTYYKEIDILISEKNISRLKEIFSVCFLNYVDTVLTPLENFGLTEYKNISFLGKFYLYLRQEGKENDFMNFPFPKYDYDTKTFLYVGQRLLNHIREDFPRMLWVKDKFYNEYHFDDDTIKMINTIFLQHNLQNIEIENLLTKKYDFKIADLNPERKSNFWCKKLRASFMEMPEWIWCLVGNIKDTHQFGEDKETRYGCKQFSGGTKVYCHPGHWGDGYENIFVTGKPRHKRNLITVVIRSKNIENFRLKQVYDKRVIEEMICGSWGGWDNSEESKETIEKMAIGLNEKD